MRATIQIPICQSLWCVGLRFESQLGRRAKNSATDCNLEDHRFHAKTSVFPSLITVTYVMWILEKPLIPLINVSQPKPHHILCDVILPCSVMYCINENKRKKSGISPQKGLSIYICFILLYLINAREVLRNGSSHEDISTLHVSNLFPNYVPFFLKTWPNSILKNGGSYYMIG